MHKGVVSSERLIILLLPLLTWTIIVDGKIFEPCRASDPNLNQCVKTTAQKLIPLVSVGISDIGFEPLDPYFLGDVTNTVGSILSFQFLNTTVYGKNSTIINDIKLNVKDQFIEADFTSDERTISNCKVNGTLLIVPIRGEGKCITDIFKAHYQISLKYDVVEGKDGKNHWKIISHNSTVYPGNMKYKFNDIFGNNNLISDAIHRFANDNWKEILEEFGQQILKRIAHKTVKQIGKLFSVIPAEDMILP